MIKKCREINRISLVTGTISVYRNNNIQSADTIPISAIYRDIFDVSTHL